MIEQALLQHLRHQVALSPYLALYGDEMAIFSQEAPADVDQFWGAGPQYGRIVFYVDVQGDPERTMGGRLTVDILCEKNKQFPEVIEPIVRELIHGWFFSNGKFTVAAQWKDSDYFTEPAKKVTGCTVTYDLLAFPMLTTFPVDVIARFNEWSAEFDGIHVINYDGLPATAWKPSESESAVYWRLVKDDPARWIPDTYQTIWRTATVRGHIFAEDIAKTISVARAIYERLYSEKRLMKEGESPIMVNRNNTVNPGADSLKTGQVTVEATFGVIVNNGNDQTVSKIVYSDNKEERRTLNGSKEPIR